MHYDRQQFSKIGRDTIEPAEEIKYEVRMGQRYRMTMYDALHINMRYCPGNIL